MKKIITSSFIAILFISLCTFAQDANDKNYDIIKANFYKQYLVYKNNLNNGIMTVKPIDPSGMFTIDEHNNFIHVDKSTENSNESIMPPWINGSPDVVSGYSFVQSSITYTPIVGTLITSGAVDDGSAANIPIGFTFNFDGVPYTAFGCAYNGYITMGTVLPAGTNYLGINGADNNMISPMGEDLLGTATGRIEYLMTGSSPNRVLTVQWSNWAFYNLGTPDGSINFQVKLYETSDSLQIIYGACTFGTLAQTPSVGIRGGSIADFNNRTTTTNWSATTAGTLISQTCSFASGIVPPTGLTFSYSPPPASPMVYTSSTAVQITNGLNITQNSINNQIIQVQVVMTGTLTPINMTSMSFNTTGTTDPTNDLTNAKVYYTGTTNVFTTTTQFGTTTSGPNGTFSVTGTQTLAAGTNYFWLVTDVPLTGPIGDYIDFQATSITGSGTMGVQTPTITNPTGRRQIDNYCRGTVSNSGCTGTGIYITNVSLNTLNNTSTCDPDANFPYAYSWFTGLSTSVEQGVTYPVSASTFSSTNQQGFALWVDWDNNNSFDAGEYLAFPLVTSGSSTTTTAYLTVPPGATVGNHRMRVRNNFSTIPTSAQPCALLSYGETEDYTLNVIAAFPMTYVSSTTTQTVVSSIYKPSLKTQIIGMQVVTNGSLTPLSATGFTLSTNGSTNAATDISNAKLWYTGIVNSFATTTQYGAAAVSPNGTFNINGSLTLAPGINYFWLTYDIPLSATNTDVVDAECNSILIGTPRTPTVTAPAGSRTIVNAGLSGNYTIPGDYPHFSNAIADLNSRGSYGPVTFNVAPGFIDTAINLTITTSGTAANPIVFKNGSTEPRAVNPIIVAGVGTSTTVDGIVKISGADYVTFDGIDLQENPANTTATQQMEWGYALVKPNGTNGCQNDIIKNCTITLNKANLPSTGIYSNNHLPTSTTSFVVSATSGANSNNQFLNNTISNAYIGIYINGYADASPYTFYDQSNLVSGNSISNYGGAANTAYGIYNIYQNGLNLSGNNINSAGGTNSTATLYGIFCSTMNNSDLTIANNTVTIVSASTTSSIFGINYGNGSIGTSNTINILNNTIQNSTYLTATTGAMYLLYCNATAGNLTISGNRNIGNIYGNATATGTTVYGIYSINSVINSISITNNLDSGNVVNGTTDYSTYRIYNSVTTNNCVITGNRIKNNTVCGTTAASTSYGIYNGAGTLTCNMSNNTVADNNLPTTSSHSMYGLYNFATAPAMDYNNNTVTGTTSTGSGSLYGMYFGASPAVNSVVNITNNSVTNLSKTTATGIGSIYGIYQGSAPQGTLNINNNTVTGFSSAAATFYAGIYQVSTPPNYININNNKVGNFTNAGISSIYGIYSTATSSSQLVLTGDSVFNITSAGSTIYGMYLTTSGLSWNVYKNSISGLTTNTSTTALAYGIYTAVSLAGSTMNLYNNFISDINTPASTSIAPALSGIYISAGAATTTINVYYNTILLNATSSGTTFGTSGIYALTTPVLDLRNNIIVNTSTPGASGGQTVAYRRSSTTLTTFANTSNNNCFYAGPPAVNRVIFYDGTNLDQTLAAYKTRVFPRCQNAVTENPPFVNGTTPPYDLRIQTAVATQLESGGQVISSPVNITSDKFGVARFPNAGYPIGGFTPTAPDIGANEFGGLNADTVSPFISYTPLGNGGTSNRTFSNVIITDANGVNVATGTKPRCYYKRSTDSNVVNDTTNITDGWKFVEATGTTTPFTFIIDYSKLVGGTGVVAGNVIQYFVIAQDLASSSNVGSNQATYAVNPTSVNLAVGNTPIANTLSYNIVTNVFSGSVNVGTAQTYTSLTGAGGLFASINAGTVTGDITAVITSDMVEDGSNALNVFNESGVGGYRLRIVPADATPKTISGTVAQGMIRFSGSRRVTIDGGSFFAEQNNKVSLNGELLSPGKYLTFRNTNGANPTIVFLNDAVGDSIKYCNIESNNTSTVAASAGTILFNTTTGTQGNDSNVITFCDIRDRSDLAGTPAFGVYNNGTTTTPQMYNSNNVISNCNIYNYFYDGGVFTGGVWLNSGTTDWTITGNSFYQTVPRTVTLGSTYASVYNNISTLTNNMQITNNYIGGSAPLCGGTPMTYTGTGAYAVFGIQSFVSVQAATNITGNTIRNINLTYNSATLNANLFRAIYAQTGWINVNNNIIGADTGTGNITLTINTTATAATVGLIHHLGLGTINDNKIGSITYAGNSTELNTLYAGIVWSNSSPTGLTFTVNNNLIGSLTTANSIQMTNNSDLHQFRAIYFTNGAGSMNNITNNTIANITSTSTSAVNGSFIYGINNNAGAGNYNFTNNTIRKLTINNDALTSGFLLLGINSTGAGINNYTQNTISSLYSNGIGAGANLVGGILAGGTTGGTVSRNKIFDLKFSGTGVLAPAPVLLGLNVQSTGAYTISNNMVSITNGDASANLVNISNNENLKVKVPETLPFKTPLNPKDYDGVSTDPKFNYSQKPSPANVSFDQRYGNNKQNVPVDNDKQVKVNGKDNKDESVVTCSLAGVFHTSTSPGACNYLYNTFYIGGTQPGALNSWTFYRFSSSTGFLNLKNNLFINARTGGTGSYYALANESTNPAAGWPPTASNYNTLICSNVATIGEWGLGNNQNMTQWVTSSNGDKQSYGTTSAAVVPTSLLTNISTGDLTIQSGNSAAWSVSGKGIALSNINTDFTGDARVTAITGGCTDIGADEFVPTPPTNPVATQVGVPGSGATSDYFVYGRKVCSIDWGTGGSAYPTGMNVNYYSGVSPSPNITTPNRNSNSYWLVTPSSGTLTGTTYTFTLYFGDNETFNITSPSTNTLLAKYGTFWQVYPNGVGDQFSNRDWNNLTMMTSGLNTFSTFALSDAALPSVVLINPAHNSTVADTNHRFFWSHAAGSTSHRIQLATDSVFNTIIKDSTTADTTKVITVANNTNYWWRVYGINGVGTGTWSQINKFRAVFGPPPPAIVNLKIIPGGFYNVGTGTLNMRDTIKAMLIDSTGCLKSDSTKAVLDSVTFNATISFSNAATGSYYLYVFHRNHVFIAARYEQGVVRGSTVNYDFTTDSAKAYGFNMIKVSTSPVRWGMIPGDANQDGFVDGLDQTIWVAQNGLDGYQSADFNGDSFVDGLDQTVWIIWNGQAYFVPCELTFENADVHAKKVNGIYNNQIDRIINPRQK